MFKYEKIFSSHQKHFFLKEISQFSHVKAFKIYNYYKDNGKALRHLKQKKHSDVLSKNRLDSTLAKSHRLIALEKQVLGILLKSNREVTG